MSTIQFIGIMALLAALAMKADPKESLEIAVSAQGLVWLDHSRRTR
ncbi:hypothetical protein J2S90_003044 [Arthrobacter bambusae]|uniref:Uncharacterized protein n=1 Tax=Arthrobacter bambusae TaxID=1338426 RepID=A0AAW8DHD9_9MICC|nr:hypothetical protein [Arthrobacter bambusae]MDQ0131132.1 hypothetical protein [Arthrobacter bambusae]MDQ0181876.1 hypothetical protein [Arthrobacter bambusae]